MQSVDVEVRAFAFSYTLTVPAQNTPAKIWVPIPIPDPHQDVIERLFDFSGSTRVQLTTKDGNHILFVQVPRSDADQRFSLSFEIERRARFSIAPALEAYAKSVDEL